MYIWNEFNDKSNNKNVVKLPWISVNGLKTRKGLKKSGCKFVLKYTPNQGSIYLSFVSKIAIIEGLILVERENVLSRSIYH